MTKLWLHGLTGRMGQEIERLARTGENGLKVVGGSAEGLSSTALAKELAAKRIDVIVDFSTPEGNALLLKAVTAGKIRGQAVLIGTTGLTTAAIRGWESAAKRQSLKLLVAPNTSIGILIGLKAALLAAPPLAALGFDVEIVETHHRMKKDAPSGTAKFFAENLRGALKGSQVVTGRKGARKTKEIGLHSVRGGGVFGEHEIRIIGIDEELRISHRAFSRKLFASGALVLCRWLAGQKPGRHRLEAIDPKSL